MAQVAAPNRQRPSSSPPVLAPLRDRLGRQPRVWMEVQQAPLPAVPMRLPLPVDTRLDQPQVGPGRECRLVATVILGAATKRLPVAGLPRRRRLPRRRP